MNCILPLIFSVPVVVLAGRMTALATVLEGTKKSGLLYNTTNDVIRKAIDLKNYRQEVTSRAGISPPLPFP